MTVNFELNAIDLGFAAFLGRLAEDAPLLSSIAALASKAVGEGNVCLNIADIAGARICIDGLETEFPEYANLRKALEETTVVGKPGEFRPLVLDGEGRLYLYRYWKYEQDLARVILEKTADVCTEIDEVILRKGLSRLFPPEAEGPDQKIMAAVAALRKKFCVISGGPGTGKTTTVVKIIAMLIEQEQDNGLRIALAAPTGKAAARLKEAVGMMKEKLDCAAWVKDRIPADVSTIHRLLGSLGGSSRFRHSPENPLPFDVVIVDEASMVALPLMARLASSMKINARLILLGDRDQLASVEAGAVLGDICGGRDGKSRLPEGSSFSGSQNGLLEDRELPTAGDPGLAGSLVILKKNYRFGTESGIGRLAAAINSGEGEHAAELLTSGRYPDIALNGLPAANELMGVLSDSVINGYGAFLDADTPESALRHIDDFRILCALRRGPFGVERINALIVDILAAKGLIEPRNAWYHGRPVMVTANDMNLKLFNGDVGIVFQNRQGNSVPRVWFPAPEGGVRDISPVQLPAHETVYAMTVHKSQGSEFDKVLLLLPNRDSAVLTRELLYTAITRAKTAVEIWGSEILLDNTVSRTIDRKSGLRDTLWCCNRV